MSRRQSNVMQPMAGGLGFDYDSEEEEETPQQAPAPAAAGADSANHRPLVGGFAAAAYEAARAHHLARQQAAKQKAVAKK